jgi:1-acyl-sn-glycerol-3-phosphate acyltransferase
MALNLYNCYLYLKLIVAVIFILINVIQYYIFPQQISKFIYIFLNKLVIFLTNSQIKIHGNVDYLNNSNLLIMTNHYDGVIDANLLFHLYYKHNMDNMLYSIVKSTIMCDTEDTPLVVRLMSYVKTGFINSSYFIPYKRGDKEDGNIVKNTIVNHLKTGKNVLIFPEGTTRTNGIPRDFKHGIFQLAVENKLNILPITLKFQKDIGSEKGESIKILNIFDNEVDIYIHERIDHASNEFYKTNDYLGLKEQVFQAVTGVFHGGHPRTPEFGEKVQEEKVQEAKVQEEKVQGEKVQEEKVQEANASGTEETNASGTEEANASGTEEANASVSTNEVLTELMTVFLPTIKARS